MVMSTTLLIGRWPAAISRAFSHSGEGPIFTSVNARAVKRGQSSGTSTVTEAIVGRLPVSGRLGVGVPRARRKRRRR